MKRYKIRAYTFDKESDKLMEDAIETNMFVSINTFKGINRLSNIYDGEVSYKGLVYLMALGIKILPLNHYEDFVITCPNCGERIDDDMILLAYDENVLSGYNILCNRRDCGYQIAEVKLFEEKTCL
jgi:hypothetical protein